MGVWSKFKAAILPTAAAEKAPARALPARGDVWVNTYSGLGTATYDPARQTSYATTFDVTRHPAVIRKLLRSNALCRKIVEKQVLMAWGAGVDYQITGGADDASTVLADEMHRLQAELNIQRARTMGRAFGGALLVVGVDDGLDPREPLQLARIRRVLYLRAVDRHDVSQVHYDTSGGMRDGEAMHYTITNPYSGSQVVVHHTRVIRFEGLEVDRRTKADLGGWSDSVLQPVYDAVRDIDSGGQSLSAQLQSAVQTVYKIKGLHDQILAGNREFVQDWIGSVELFRSSMRAVGLDADGEDITTESKALGDATQVYFALQHRVAAAASMPITELFGAAPGGFNTDDMSGHRRFYDKITAEERHGQQGYALDHLLIMLAHQQQVPALQGASITVQWPSLYSPTAKEKAELDNLQAQTAIAFLDAGVLSPDEIRPLAADLVGVDVTTAPASPTITDDVAVPAVDDIATADLADDDDDEDGQAYGDALYHIKGRWVDQATKVAEKKDQVLWSRTLPIIARELEGLPAAEVLELTEYSHEQWLAIQTDFQQFMSIRDPATYDKAEVRRMMRRRARMRADHIVQRIKQAHARNDIAEAGDQFFMWQTMGDDKVRDSHAAINGQLYTLANGHPEFGFPGDPPNCRCVAVPVPAPAEQAPAEQAPAEQAEAARGDRSYRPPQAVRKAAAKALEVRRSKPASQRGMTPVGLARARDLAAGRPISEETIRRMVAYFARHEIDKKGSTWPDYGKGRQAWLGWGGDPGRAWAEKVLREIEQAKGDDQGAKTPAAPDEQITGSKRNAPGTASGKRGGIEIAPSVEKALMAKATAHNEKHGKDPAKATDVGALKAVWRRGAGAFSATHRPGMTRQQWAMGRVNAFLHLLRTGIPENSSYTTDNDLLPEDHPRHTAEEDGDD
jgi:phage-related protein (TIGR01555 family)